MVMTPPMDLTLAKLATSPRWISPPMVERSAPWGASFTSIPPPIFEILISPESFRSSESPRNESASPCEYLHPETTAGIAPTTRIRKIAPAFCIVIQPSPTGNLRRAQHALRNIRLRSSADYACSVNSSFQLLGHKFVEHGRIR